MRYESEDFTIDCTQPGRAKLEGVLRLSSPAAYEDRFEPLRQGLQESDSGYTVDISKVQFLNSSGITGLSRLVLMARAQSKPITIVGSSSVAWQSKTLRLLERLYDKLDIRLE